MSSDVLVRVDSVSKKFCRNLKRSLWYGLKDTAFDLCGGRPSHQLRPDEFWAVDNVSLELARGECLGLIGRNGAGKTTLLKMLNGLIKPDTGRIELAGRVGALIALGAGFNPLLTGRENIYINGAVLGFTKREVDRQFDDIVDFAELREFIDTPVQNYSSGMQVRLGFAVAVRLIRPDVLMLDEVIAVGDESFRAKCYQVISEMLGRCAVIFVSHSMPMINRISTRVLVLSNGGAIFSGLPAPGIETYLRSIDGRDTVVHRSLGTGEAVIQRLSIEDERGVAVTDCQYSRPWRLSMDITISAAFPEYDVSVTFMSSTQELVAQCHSRANRERLQHDGRPHRIVLDFSAQLLNPGRYWLNVAVFDKSGMRHLCWEFAVLQFTVVGGFVGTAPVQMVASWHTTPVGLDEQTPRAESSA